MAGRPGVPVAALNGVRPPVGQLIRKVVVVHSPIRTCVLFVQPGGMMPAGRSRRGAGGRGLKNPSHTVTEHRRSEHAEHRL